MKEIKLTKGLTTQVDDEDYEYLNQFKWYAFKRRYTYYAGRSKYQSGVKKTILMHRVVMNTPFKLVPDHIDHNGLNNQKTNLRNVTNSENNRNRINRSNKNLHKYKTSNYYGVCVLVINRNNKEYIYYRTYVYINNKSTYIGCFKKENEAAFAYNEATKKYCGEFANLNIIE